MKILQLNAVYGVGSTGVIVRDIHRLCLENNIESVVCFSEANDSVENGFQIGTALGKKLHAFLCRISGKQGYFSRASTKRLIKIIEKEQPDIVNLHNVHSNFVNLNMLLDYLAEKNIKTVATLHDCWFYTGGCFHYTNAGCERWLDACGNCPNRFVGTPAYLFDASPRILADRIEHFGKIKNLTFVGVSQWITDEAKRSKVNAKRYETVYNGIDLELFRKTESDVRESMGIGNRFLILAMANKWLLDVNKGLLESFSEHIGNDAVILLVGCDAEKANNLPDNVIPIDFVKDRLELVKIYSAADVFVNPTREESLSLVNVEAQACETPVVTYKNTGAQETVDNINSFSVESGNIQALLDAVLKIKNSDNRDFSKCREFVSERFDKNKNYNQLIELYKTIFKEHNL